jgi:hypothetical protein
MNTAVPSKYQRGARFSRRQVMVQQGLGMHFHRVGLSAEEAPPAAVLLIRHVARGQVHHLVVHEHVNPLDGRERLKRVVQGGYIHPQNIGSRGRCPRVTVIGIVLQHQGRFLVRRPVENFALEFERVLISARHVRHEVGGQRVKIEQAEVVRFLLVDPEGVGLGMARHQ